MTKTMAGALGVLSGSILAMSMLAAPASAAPSSTIPEGTHVDPSFSAGEPTIVVGKPGRDGAARGAFCPDKAFTAIATMLSSVPGCNVIGWNNSAKVSYGWYKHQGNGSPCIWGKGFNANRQPVWPAMGCGNGRQSTTVPWGNVAASKQIRGLAPIGWAGVQWN